MTEDHTDRLNAALEGRYRIERQLGEGGMATVYLADDLRHERKVALKVLKPELAAVVGADRFLAEIKTTANLQHPRILPLFDSGEADSFLFYVMPYVEGESLRDRLDRERQLPVDEAVRIATGVAEALDHAHRHGVVHRDIKPANVLLVDGQPVLSDFGVALAVGSAGRGRLTETGLSVGTPHYMSPEQATGDQIVGQATDIYALGCVLYEMLVGEPPYTGSTAQAILGKIIQAKPVSATETRGSVPANVDAAIRKSLEKVSADRFASARDLIRALADPGFRHGEGEGAAPARSGSRWNATSVTFATLFALTGAVLAWSILRSTPAAAPPRAVSFAVSVDQVAEVYLGGARGAAWGRPAFKSLALSPDGGALVYAGWRFGPGGEVTSRLYLRRFDRLEPVPIEGTEGADAPFFSPDGAWVGFWDQDGPALRRVSLEDGAVETIVQDAPVVVRATWGENDIVLYDSPNGVFRVSALGGTPELVVAPDTVPGGLRLVVHPEWLPGDRAILFAGARGQATESAEILALELASGTRTSLLTNAADPQYLETGHLLFIRQGTLMAVAFDPVALEVLGEPVPVMEDVQQALEMPNGGYTTGVGQVAVSRDGHLAYASGGLYPGTLYTPRRVALDGSWEPMGLEARRYTRFRVSPEGRRLAYQVSSAEGGELFVYDLERGVARQLNTGFSSNAYPAWSPDGRYLAFTAADEPGTPSLNLYRMSVDGTGQPERLAPSDSRQLMADWSSAGVLAFLEEGDIWVIPPDGEPAPFVTSDGVAAYASFSPDGQWLVYTLTDGGPSAVYVRPYPGPGAATLVSADGGSPAWSPDGGTLYFTAVAEGSERRLMMAAQIDVAGELRVGRATAVIDPWPYPTWVTSRGYDVMADGSFIAPWREIDAEVPEGSGANPLRIANRVEEINVVLGWLDELRERVPVD